MAEEKILGVNGFTEQPTRRRFQQGQGWMLIRSWEGPQALEEAKVNDIMLDDPEDIAVTRGVPCVIEASFAQDSVDEASTWELIPSPMDRPLGSHPAFGFTGNVAPAMEAVEQAIRQGFASEIDYDTLWGVTGINDYRNLRLKGVDSYRTWTWVIRKTLTTSRSDSVKAEQTDTQRIITYNQIGVPGSVKWTQPKMVKWDGANATELYIDAWMVVPPTVRYERKKYSITKEWIGALAWYAKLYAGGLAASTSDGNSK